MFSFLCGVCPQLFVCWFSVWRISTVVCLLIYCMTFVHSCLSIGFLCDVCPQLFVSWFTVWPFSTVVCLMVFCVTFVHRCVSVGFCDVCPTTMDKRHTENQQTNNCGKTSHGKPTDKQLWTNVTQKTVWRLSTVVCLLVFCVTFVHSC
jgi:hypothetical protein